MLCISQVMQLALFMFSSETNANARMYICGFILYLEPIATNATCYII